ncbi:MAG: deoxyribose-phosphate aldolase [Crocinitomicaceae bacterium]|nr:deoxyribose-phosphate aldolase [Crocinitomicaceae bacterium]MDP4724556.1 deoxyribose-phosphate aldolase [Crocinitomicaceae bacterium]MDP4739086.1 deoxyribose-phosphate aldolase [Crocinitomicaceae bacterium]MDP4799768.1 deoxyribose-phosphate aldolase [Crocinitomicaceae bacterium]MDP4806129.1 deoxyribose-phosphate aldolase [Crocinitomicaceae bacterium]
MLASISPLELSALLANTPPIDQIGTLERIARIQARSIKGAAKLQGLRMALSMIDLTTLEGKDTPAKVRQLCYKAQHLHDQAADLPIVAAVCVYPTMVGVAKQALGNSGIKVASVSTAFPSGQAPFEVKKLDTLYALDNGADEIDMVISRGRFLAGDYQFVYDEIAAIKALCGAARLKVIFETGELDSLDQVRKISDLAIAAGADFIKTSTGKIQPAATFPVVLTMLGAIKDHYDKTGQMIGMKPAGGISSSKLALQHLLLVKEVLGEAWLSNEWYRFGASSLANDLLMQYQKQLTGKYQSAAYFSID